MDNLDDVPNVLSRVAELAASNTSRQRVVADTDGIVLVLIREVVRTLGHGTDEDADALLCVQILNVVSYSDDRRIEGQRDLSTVWWEMVGDGILNDLEELLLRRGGADRQLMKELDHETGEALEGTWDADSGRDLDQDTFGGVDINLKLASLIEGRVKQREETLLRRVSTEEGELRC